MIRQKMQNSDDQDLDSISNLKVSRLRKGILAWAERNLRDFPWRNNPVPFQILVAEVLLRRTTATAVLRIYPSFMKKYCNPKKIFNTEEAEIESALLTIGYQKQRAKILKQISKFLVEELNSSVPCSRDSLLKIPNVGSYTAGAILSLGCGQSAAMVDTNVRRVYGRIFLSCLPEKAKNRFIEELADNCVPKLRHQRYNLALLDLGALVCTYGIPRCQICPISELCDYFLRGMPSR